MKNIKTIQDIKVGDRFRGQINNVECVINEIFKENGRWYLLIIANNIKVVKPFDYFKRLQLERI